MQHLVKKAIVISAIILVAIFVVVGNRVAAERRLNQRLDSAKQAIDNREFRVASAILDEYLEQRPDDLDVRLLAAQTARRQSDFVKARNHLRAHLDRNGPALARHREEQLLSVQADSSSDGKALLDHCLSSDPNQAIDLELEVAIGKQLLVIESAYHDGKTLVEGPFGEAVRRTGEAIRIWLHRRPNRADQIQGFIWKGKIAMFINQEDAVADFRRGVALDPNHVDARINLAITLAEFDVREAITHLELIHQRAPQNQHVSVLLASLNKNLGQLTRATELLDQVLENHPDHTAALQERAKLAMDQGDFRTAERLFRRALVALPNELFLHLALSRCLFQLGNELEARQHEQKYTELQTAELKSQTARSEAERAWRKKMQRQLNQQATEGTTR